MLVFLEDLVGVGNQNVENLEEVVKKAVEEGVRNGLKTGFVPLFREVNLNLFLFYLFVPNIFLCQMMERRNFCLEKTEI